MNLITPDGGLLFWMVVIFAVVLFILAKWGFPIITSSVEARSKRIADSLRKADEVERKEAIMAEESTQAEIFLKFIVLILLLDRNNNLQLLFGDFAYQNSSCCCHWFFTCCQSYSISPDIITPPFCFLPDY